MEISYVGKCLLVNVDGRRILVVGDLHLGYEESLNRSGVLVGRGMFDEMIGEFDLIFSKVGRVDEIVLLGDVKHFFGGVIKQEWNDVLRVFDYFSKWCDKIMVVKGNHDIFLPGIVRQRKGIELAEKYIVSGVCFVHGDRKIWCGGGVEVLVLGHWHPAVVVEDKVRREKYKCFLVGDWKGRKVIIVPSFFSGFEGTEVRDGNFSEFGKKWGFDLRKFDVKVVSSGGLEVLDFGKLGKLDY